jgi:hypothetical protein
MHGNVLLAMLALAVTVLAAVPMMVAGFTSGRSGGRLRARTAGSASSDTAVPQWHVHRVNATVPVGAQGSAEIEQANVSGSTSSLTDSTDAAIA